MSESVMTTREMNGGISQLHSADKRKHLGDIIINNNNNNLDRKSAGPKVSHLDNENLLSLDGDVEAHASLLQRFYSGASVFVTGATGFMGKVLIEKLLRSCPDINCIYILVREKKGRSMEERIDDLINSPCFDRIKKEHPKFRTKLHGVAGDIGLEGLGLSESDRELLKQEVDIVFHVAATVRFDEKLKSAIFSNVRGTREMMNLCHSFRKLRSVLHVSTAYANSPAHNIDDCLFDAPLGSTKAIQIAETLDMELMEKLAPTIIGEWPNSYAFTKAVSEDAVKTYGQGLPIGIFRPGIVVCTKEEPMPGWIDNMYGPTGFIAGVAAGILRTMQGDLTNEANIVPCDMVINAMVAAAWDVANKRDSQEIPVFNYVAPHDNPVTWQEFTSKYCKHGIEHPPLRAVWFYSLTSVTNRAVYLFCRFFLHLLPALLVDLFLLTTNQKPQVMQVYNKIHRFTDVISYFTLRQWKFQDDNIVDLWGRLDPRDRELFFFDMRSLDWDAYIKQSCPGLRLYVFKDPPHTLEAAKTRFRRLFVLHRLTQLLFVCLLIWLSLLAITPIFSSHTISPLPTIAPHQDTISVT